jgi:hypothetical protein
MQVGDALHAPFVWHVAVVDPVSVKLRLHANVTESPVTPAPGLGGVTVPFSGAAGTAPHEFTVHTGAALQAPLVWQVAVAEPVNV